MTEPKALEILSLDLWGNDDDGYEVNEVYSTGIELLVDMDDDYYYRQVREFFPHLPSFRIVWDDDTSATIYRRSDDKPLLGIQAK